MRFRNSTGRSFSILGVLGFLGVSLAGVGEGRAGEADFSDHWAFRPVEKAAWPEARQGGGRWDHPVDAWIGAALEGAGISPEPLVDDRVLVRRLSINLLGRPPGMDEIRRFAEDSHVNRQERVVDRLLASPQYGEHWARHWLDVARYSDTKGYTYAGEEPHFVHAWLYRDWVVNAFNRDLPYDVFVQQQLAADKLCDQDQGDREDLAAMGYLTLGRRFLGVEQDIIDDRIDVVTRGLMGLTVSCARCHDHKYDPVTAADYYSLYSIFKSSVKKMVPLKPCADEELREKERVFQEHYATLSAELGKAYLERLEEYLLAALDIAQVPPPDFSEIVGKDDLIPAQIRRWYEFLSQSVRAEDPVFAPWKVLEALPAEQMAEEAPLKLQGLTWANRVVVTALREARLESMADVVRVYVRLIREAAERGGEGARETEIADQAGSEHAEDWAALETLVDGPESPIRIPELHIHATEWLFYTDAKSDLNGKQAEVERRILALGEGAPHAVILEDRRPSLNSRVLLRGQYALQGEEAQRRFLSFLSGCGSDAVTEGSGRLDLARAITHPDNPLTARVLVNRLWQHHFGRGLVPTSSDFGLRSERPSHPELLDFLALRLGEDGWSIKRIQRLLATSAIYERASMPVAGAVDSENRLLAGFPRRRMALEVLRDALLQASGELDTRMGGPPAGELVGAGATVRRSVYGRIDRQFLPQTLQVFDFPNPELHAPERVETGVPQQALFFLNSPFVLERARALAERLERVEPGEPRERVRMAYQIVFQRDPTPAQEERAMDFLRKGWETDQADVVDPPTVFCGRRDDSATVEVGTEAGDTPAAEGAQPSRLTAWERFAQTLLLSNEFVFME